MKNMKKKNENNKLKANINLDGRNWAKNPSKKRSKPDYNNN